MRLFDCDWSQILAQALAWDRLPAECKTLFLERAEPARPLPVEGLGLDPRPLVEGGFLECGESGDALALPESQRPFRRVVRAMSRHDMFHGEGSDAEALEAYLREHFTLADRRSLLGQPWSYGLLHAEVGSRVGQEGWLRSFLEERDFTRWEGRFAPSGWEPLLASARTFRRAKELLALLMESPAHGVPLATLAGAADPEAAADNGPALRALIGYALVFPGLLGPDRTLAAGIWRALHRRLHRAPVEAPKTVAVARTFESAFLMHDMTVLLVACSAQPIRLRVADGRMFARAEKAVAERMSTLPDWVREIIPWTPEARLRLARGALARTGLTRVAGRRNQPELLAGKGASAWLGGTVRERLRSLLDGMREDLRRRPGTSYSYYDDDDDDDDDDRGHGLAYFTEMPLVHSDDELVDLRPDVVETYLEAAQDGPVPLGDFLEHHSEERNPILSMRREGKRLWILSGYRGGDDGDEQPVKLWRQVLERFLVDRLVPLGCAALGVTETGGAAFALTGAGRYLLGADDDFEYGGAEEAGQVVVQPNFEVMFLAPSPLAEAALGPLAERIGSELGAVFRVTRKSVQEAFVAGMAGEAVVARLGELSSKPVPGNVARQILDWAGQCRRIRISPAILLECPDAETALRVLSAGGAKLTRVSETVLSLKDRKALRGIEGKLRQEGVVRERT